MSHVRADEYVVDHLTGVYRSLLSVWQPSSSFRFRPHEVDLTGQVAVVTGDEAWQVAQHCNATADSGSTLGIAMQQEQ